MDRKIWIPSLCPIASAMQELCLVCMKLQNEKGAMRGNESRVQQCSKSIGLYVCVWNACTLIRGVTFSFCFKLSIGRVVYKGNVVVCMYNQRIETPSSIRSARRTCGVDNLQRKVGCLPLGDVLMDLG